jgi:hypothetical protein
MAKLYMAYTVDETIDNIDTLGIDIDAKSKVFNSFHFHNISINDEPIAFKTDPIRLVWDAYYPPIAGGKHKMKFILDQNDANSVKVTTLLALLDSKFNGLMGKVKNSPIAYVNNKYVLAKNKNKKSHRYSYVNNNVRFFGSLNKHDDDDDDDDDDDKKIIQPYQMPYMNADIFKNVNAPAFNVYVRENKEDTVKFNSKKLSFDVDSSDYIGKYLGKYTTVQLTFWISALYWRSTPDGPHVCGYKKYLIGMSVMNIKKTLKDMMQFVVDDNSLTLHSVNNGTYTYKKNKYPKKKKGHHPTIYDSYDDDDDDENDGEDIEMSGKKTYIGKNICKKGWKSPTISDSDDDSDEDIEMPVKKTYVNENLNKKGWGYPVSISDSDEDVDDDVEMPVSISDSDDSCSEHDLSKTEKILKMKRKLDSSKEYFDKELGVIHKSLTEEYTVKDDENSDDDMNDSLASITTSEEEDSDEEEPQPKMKPIRKNRSKIVDIDEILVVI